MEVLISLLTFIITTITLVFTIRYNHARYSIKVVENFGLVIKNIGIIPLTITSFGIEFQKKFYNSTNQKFIVNKTNRIQNTMMNQSFDYCIIDPGQIGEMGLQFKIPLELIGQSRSYLYLVINGKIKKYRVKLTNNLILENMEAPRVQNKNEVINFSRYL